MTELRSRIMEQAGALFMRNGIKSVSMDDIAAELAMSKKTLYKTFANKDELVLATMAARLERVQHECVSVSSQSPNAVAQMLDISRWADEQFGDIHPSIFYDLRKYHPQAWLLFRGHKSNFILKQIVGILERGKTEGLFRANLDVDVLARLNLAQIDLTFDPDLYPPAQFSPVRVNHVFDEHFLLGVVTREGYELFYQYTEATAGKLPA